MATPNYPKHRTNKDLEVRFAPHQGNLGCNYGHVKQAFGNPTVSVDNNDSFEGTETCAWYIQFESGETAILAENREFGNQEDSYELAKSWKVNSRFPRTYEWIKQIIRDANPSEVAKTQQAQR